MEEEYKGYKIVSDGGYNMKVIKAIGRGSVPNELRGHYTNSGFAKKDIDLHESKKKVTKGGETE